MLRKNIAVLVIVIAAMFSMGGSPLVGLHFAGNQSRNAVTKNSMSESTSLLIFGSGLWALAMLRRQRRPNPGV